MLRSPFSVTGRLASARRFFVVRKAHKAILSSNARFIIDIGIYLAVHRVLKHRITSTDVRPDMSFSVGLPFVVQVNQHGIMSSMST